MSDLFFCTAALLELWLGWFLLFHDCLTGIIIWLILFDFYYTTVLYQLWFAWSLLFHDCFIAIMIRLISSFPPPFNCIHYLADFFFYLVDFFFNYHSVALFDSTTVFLGLRFGWFLLLHHGFIALMIWLISSMVLLFSYNYHLADFSYSATVLLELWFGWFLLLQHYFISIIIRLLSFVPPLFSCD